MFFFLNYKKELSSGLNLPQSTSHQLIFIVFPPPGGVNLQMLAATFQHSNN